MSIKPISVPTKTLAQNLAADGTTLYLNNTLSWDGVQLTSADFGTELFATLRNAANTQVEFVQLDPSTVDSNSAITITKRALGYDGTTTAATETAYAWSANDTYVELGAATPQIMAQLVEETGAETIAGKKTFSSVPATTGGDPVEDNDLVRKSWVTSLVTGGTISVNRTVIAGTGGAVIAAGELVYLDTADGEWKLCDADTAATVENVILGIAQGAGTDGGAITGGVLTHGIHTTTGLTANTKYYASNTAGALSTSAGTKEVSVGFALSTTSLFFDPQFDQKITEDIQDALAGTGGTVSSTNKFVTEDGTSTVQSRLTEETASGITAGVPVFIQSDGEATKTATVKTFIADNISHLFTQSTTYAIKLVRIAWLTEDVFATTYVQQLSGSPTYAQYTSVGTLNNGRVSIWSTVEVDTISAAYSKLHIKRLSSSKYLVAGFYSSSTTKIKIASLNTDRQISLGTEESVSSENFFDIDVLSDSSFVTVSRNSSTDDIEFAAYTISGTTITNGSSIVLDTAVSEQLQVIGLSSTKAVAVWNSGSASLKARVVNISGTTSTAAASSYEVASGDMGQVLTGLIGENKFAVVYREPTSAFDIQIVAATVSDDTITVGTPVEVYDGNTNTQVLGLCKYDEDSAVVYYRETSGSSTYGLSFAYVTFSGTTATIANTILISDPIINDNNASGEDGVFMMNGLVVFTNILDTRNHIIKTFKPVFNEVLMGVAKSAPVSNVVPVIQKGRTGSIYSGLTFGKKYRFNLDGTINENGIIPGGTAISTTELLID